MPTRSSWMWNFYLHFTFKWRKSCLKWCNHLNLKFSPYLRHRKKPYLRNRMSAKQNQLTAFPWRSGVVMQMAGCWLLSSAMHSSDDSEWLVHSLMLSVQDPRGPCSPPFPIVLLLPSYPVSRVMTWPFVTTFQRLTLSNWAPSAASTFGSRTPYGVSAYSPIGRRRSFVPSSITKWATQISQERFDLESQNSTRTSILDIEAPWTSPATSGRHLSSKLEKKRLPTTSGSILVVQCFEWPNQLVGFLFCFGIGWRVCHNCLTY